MYRNEQAGNGLAAEQAFELVHEASPKGGHRQRVFVFEQEPGVRRRQQFHLVFPAALQ